MERQGQQLHRLACMIAASRRFPDLVALVEKHAAELDAEYAVLLDLQNLGELPCLVCKWRSSKHTAAIVERLSEAVMEYLWQIDPRLIEQAVSASEIRHLLSQGEVLHLDGLVRFRLHGLSGFTHLASD